MSHSIDDPSDFQSSELQKLDEHLRCPICKELFTTAMMISTCSHSFCALCVHRCLSEEQLCPKCRKEAFSNSIVHNYDLDNVVHIWRLSRNVLASVDKSLNTPCQQQEPIEQKQKGKQKDDGNSLANVNSLPNINQIHIDDDTDADFKPSSNIRHMSQVGTRRSTRLEKKEFRDLESLPQSSQCNQQFESQSYNTLSLQDGNEPLKSTSMVQCPICTQSMKYVVLDKHLDGCTNGDSSIPPSPPPTPSNNEPMASFSQRSNGALFMQSKIGFNKSSKSVNLGKKPGKVVYAMQKDKDMKKILKDLGLPEDGDKAQKVWRHKEYINLYNANLESHNPVSAEVLIKRLAEIERTHEANKNNQIKRKNIDSDTHNILFDYH
ncbi:hypothetical protein G6F57_000467 [Rhizopus arrhizus]|uniref:Postreplication repair E3 ubiquitin-protein ligase RAD18 n=1 Tax=Rhizopus oryzae TaxID=64495 RepID=A0A9P7BUZ4_RHIOR|nr:hypothetical protein G6F30_004644 [Rhizopus arrhizus]KAG1411005.1 hypothetical protein G6F58_008802 [Rhizopus delemar]KAG0984152.1 hypothetical protein G6F29_004985 [Rhizopus arrhizus]KAG0997566.1 hypothetical protein G6F28_002778 [Rhizopus arrhizus]KAG1010464.1 hypothetical protein G6F27_004635 [Rhizopus arrhizus]